MIRMSVMYPTTAGKKFDDDITPQVQISEVIA